jgi:hypothetical protein
MRPRLAASFLFLIFVLFPFGCSRPYLRQPIPESAPTRLELLIVKPGNYPGTFGHVALRYGDEVFGYWESRDHKLAVGYFLTDAFFRYYLVYHQRDVHGFELDVASERTGKILRILHDQKARPPEERPPYSMGADNCVVAAYRVLCEALDRETEPPPPLPSVFPGGLERWAKQNFVIVEERYYRSTRHLYMKKRKERGEGVAKELFVPLSRSDPHVYKSWRLVFTEDLRGPLLPLRPLAGAANTVTGAVQLGLSPLFLPMGKFHSLPGGLYGMSASLPECLFLAFRRAGKTPMHPDGATRIMENWEPERNQDEQPELLPESGSPWAH